MINIQNDINVFQNVLERAEQTKNYLLSQVKKVTTPLSNYTVYCVISLTDKSLKLVNHFRSEAVLPALSKSIEGMNDITGVASTINSLIGYLPFVTSKNLDEDKIKSLFNTEAEKALADRVVKQVKISLKKRCTRRAVLADLNEMLKKESVSPEEIKRIITEIKIQKKIRPLIERTYNYFFLVPGINSALKTLEKWDIFKYGKAAEAIGNSRIAATLSHIVGPKVTNFVVRWSISDLAKYCGLTGMSIKWIYDGHKLYTANADVKRAAPASPEYIKGVEERVNRIWTFSLDTLTVTGMIVPMAVAVNPTILIVYGVGVAALYLVNEIRS